MSALRAVQGFAFVVFVLALAPGVGAATVPFFEDFPVDAAGWEDNVNNPVFWEPSGGPDGSSFISADFDFTGFVSPFEDAGPIVFRAHDEDLASGGAFVGDWLADGVAEVRVWVRHDAPVDLMWILRIATASNFPGAIFDEPDGGIVPPNLWTELRFKIAPDTELCTVESFDEEFTCADALGAVGHLQLGVDAPQVLIDDELTVMLDVDQVELVPEPASVLVLTAGAGGLLTLARRRRV